jgi:hypothetical protein
MAIEFNNIGTRMLSKSNLDQALEYAKLALTIDEESKDMLQVALDYFNLASICNLKQSNEEEIVYHKKIKQLLESFRTFENGLYYQKNKAIRK